MTFSAAEILGEFAEAQQLWRARFETRYDASIEARLVRERAECLARYHELHSRPYWRKARAKKEAARRARMKLEGREVWRSPESLERIRRRDPNAARKRKKQCPPLTRTSTTTPASSSSSSSSSSR